MSGFEGFGVPDEKPVLSIYSPSAKPQLDGDLFQQYASAGFDVDILPIVAANGKLAEGTTVSDANQAKTPGFYSPKDGLWKGRASWNDRDATPDEIGRWASWPNAGLGIRTKRIAGVDIDFTIEALADKIEQMALDLLGPAPSRTGNPPKRLLPYRVSLPGKIRITAERESDGDVQAVEILANGQMFVAEGVHGRTGKPYEWSRGSLLSLGLSGLTTITPEAVQAFRAAVVEHLMAELGPLGYVINDSESGGGEKSEDRTVPLTTEVSAWDRKRTNDLIANTGHLSEGDRNGGLSQLGMAIKDFVGDRAEFDSFMWDAYQKCAPTLDQSEFETIRDSAWKNAQNRPGSKAEAVAGPEIDFGDFSTAYLAADGRKVDAASPEEAAKLKYGLWDGDKLIGEIDPPRAESGALAKGEGTKKRRLTIEFADDLQFALNRKYLIKGLFDQDGTSVIFGKPNVGKSFAALDMAAHVALGRPWRDHRVKQMGVLYVAAEGAEGLPARIEAWKRHHNVDRIPCLAVIRRKVELRSQNGDASEIVDLVREVEKTRGFKVGWVIVDTLARALAGGDESSSVDMGAAIDSLDHIRLGARCHASFVHHSGKDEAKGARGHSSLLGAIDTEIEVKGDRIVNDKQRDMAKQMAMGFKLDVVSLGMDDEGDPITSCVVLPASLTADTDMQMDERTRDTLAALLDVLQAHDGGEPMTVEKAAERIRDVTGANITVGAWRARINKAMNDGPQEFDGHVVRLDKIEGHGSNIKTALTIEKLPEAELNMQGPFS